MGGDLNVSTQLPAPYGRWSRSIFDRIEGFGLVDLTAATVAKRPELRIEDCSCGEDDCGHLQTCTQRPGGKRYQNDYLFASRALADRLEDCYVMSDGAAFSDHWPVVAEFST
jgi:hypothetical protein